MSPLLFFGLSIKPEHLIDDSDKVLLTLTRVGDSDKVLLTLISDSN